MGTTFKYIIVLWVIIAGFQFERLTAQCPEPLFSNPQRPACWEEGGNPIQLAFGLVADEVSGMALQGEVEWQESGLGVSVTGEFIPPEKVLNSEYWIYYTWTDDISSCSFEDSVFLEVFIKPDAEIIAPDTICITDNAIILSNFEALNDEFPTWNFGTGSFVSTDGFGPYSIVYPNPGDYITTLSVSNTTNCRYVIEKPIHVVRDIPLLQIDCKSDSSTQVLFEWQNVVSVDSFIVSINNGPEQVIVGTSYLADSLINGQEVTIAVTPISFTECEGEKATRVCKPISCPISVFDTMATYHYEFCELDFMAFQLGDIELLLDAPLGRVQSETWRSENGSVDDKGELDPSVYQVGDTIEVSYMIRYEQLGCTYDTSFTILINESPSIDTVRSIVPECILDTVRYFEVLSSVDLEDYVVFINDVETRLIDNRFSYNISGVHTIRIESPEACAYERLFRVDENLNELILEIIGPDSLINGEQVFYTPMLSQDDISSIEFIEWYIDGMLYDTRNDLSSLELSADFDAFGNEVEVTAVVHFTEDCNLVASRTSSIFDDRRMYVPNAVNPEDPSNDVWRIFTNESINLTELTIFDRWGNQIYQLEFDELSKSMSINADGENIIDWDTGWRGQAQQSSSEFDNGLYLYRLNTLEFKGTVQEKEVSHLGEIYIIK